MAEFLFTAAALVTAFTAIGLARILRGPTAADRMMAAQLLGSGGVATLLLIGAATGMAGVVDAALVLALLAAFASAAFVHAAQQGPRDPAEDGPQ